VLHALVGTAGARFNAADLLMVLLLVLLGGVVGALRGCCAVSPTDVLAWSSDPGSCWAGMSRNGIGWVKALAPQAGRPAQKLPESCLKSAKFGGAVAGEIVSVLVCLMACLTEQFRCRGEPVRARRRISCVGWLIPNALTF